MDLIYSIEFDGDTIRIWKREAKSPNRHRFIDSQWHKNALIAASSMGLRDKRNITVIYMSDGTSFELSRVSIEKIERKCGLKRTHHSCAVMLNAVDRLKIKGRKIAALGIINQKCLFPMSNRRSLFGV